MTFSIKNTLAAIDRRSEKLSPAPPESRVNPNSFANRIARAKQNEQAVRAQIELLRGEKNSELKQARLAVAFERLAELYAEQGDYRSAIEVTQDPKRRAVYEAAIEAIERPDDEICDCPSERTYDSAAKREIALRPQVVTETIVSEKHNRLVDVELCSRCGHRNAR